ncbi:hypothetical protein BT96DRAFT_949883 [Gymnopus androsaceus JB14]|uniref:Uncharacterized protein n=1 Tax=Gymnopus androsaceus JB14 TaxID=1447944 RepID=A0A6A4GJA1_9AGAR|nr:hypothetical protein BT96DRAFT_949883 [Gymnopus androsaceus JB14]
MTIFRNIHLPKRKSFPNLHHPSRDESQNGFMALPIPYNELAESPPLVQHNVTKPVTKPHEDLSEFKDLFTKPHSAFKCASIPTSPSAFLSPNIPQPPETLPKRPRSSSSSRTIRAREHPQTDAGLDVQHTVKLLEDQRRVFGWTGKTENEYASRWPAWYLSLSAKKALPNFLGQLPQVHR